MYSHVVWFLQIFADINFLGMRKYLQLINSRYETFVVFKFIILHSIFVDNIADFSIPYRNR